MVNVQAFYKNTSTSSTHLKKEHLHLMQVALEYQATAQGQTRYTKDLQKYGSTPASEKTRATIYEYLQKEGYTSHLPQVFRLEKNTPIPNHVLGLTSAQCIWIDEDSLAPDQTSFVFTCAHEAGHWYHQHSIQDMIKPETALEYQEYEADLFALKAINPSTRKTILARAQQAAEPVNYLNDEQKIALLKPQMTKTQSGIFFDLPLPTPEHAVHILTIAQHHSLI